MEHVHRISHVSIRKYNHCTLCIIFSTKLLNEHIFFQKTVLLKSTSIFNNIYSPTVKISFLLTHMLHLLPP